MKKLVIEKDKLIKNIDLIIKKAAPARVIAVLKGNGYGLGIVPFAQILLERGVDFFAVSEIEEARKLRDAGVEAEILLLTSTAVKEDAKRILELNLTASIGSLQALEVLEQTAAEEEQKVKAHIKIDTGFGRFGFLPPANEELIQKIKALNYVQITGVFSHLSFSFAKDKKPSQKQFVLFEQFVKTLEEAGISFETKHIANSCAFLRWDEFHLNAVRIGSAFLGRLPIAVDLPLHKIGILKTNVIELKTLPKKHNVGYANTIATKKETVIGVVPVGYMDGYGVEKQLDTFRMRDILRTILAVLLTKPHRAIINGKSVPLIGRIGMYNIILDLTGHNINVGDEVTLACNPILLDGSVERSYE